MTRYTSQRRRTGAARRPVGARREGPRYKADRATSVHRRPERGRGGRGRAPRGRAPRGRAPRGRAPRGRAPRGARGGTCRHGNDRHVQSTGGETGHGRPPKRRYEDTADYEDMQVNPAIASFLKRKEFRKGILSGMELADFVQAARDVEANNHTIRHQFMIRLVQSIFMEAAGPLMKTLMAWIFTPPSKQEGERACSVLLDLVEEMLVRIPHCRNTISYTATIMEMLSRVGKVLHLELETRIHTLLTRAQDQTVITTRTTWNPDNSFIDEDEIPEKLTDLLQTVLDDHFTNPSRGAHASKEHYLESWYRMMREDFMAPLRTAVAQFRDTFKPGDVPVSKTGRIRLDGGFHYYFPRILECESEGGDRLYRLQLAGQDGVDWSVTDRLTRPDSLILLSSDHYQTARHALVTVRWEDRDSQNGEVRDQKRGSVWVRVQGDPLDDTVYHGVEATALWEPTRCVLERLQQLARKVKEGETLPFQRYIVDAETGVSPPRYMSNSKTLLIKRHVITVKKRKKNTEKANNEWESAAREISFNNGASRPAEESHDIHGDISDMEEGEVREANSSDREDIPMQGEREERNHDAREETSNGGTGNTTTTGVKENGLIRRATAYCRSKGVIHSSEPVLTATADPDVSGLGLDLSQEAALKLALTHELALIQGPPGTGKSHVGAMFVKIMMLNKPLWQRFQHGSILLLAYKNHAIDQFLRECEALGVDMTKTVRVGAGGDDDMGKYLLRNRRRELGRYHEYLNITMNAAITRKQMDKVKKDIRENKRAISCPVVDTPLGNYPDVIPENTLASIRDWADSELEDEYWRRHRPNREQDDSRESVRILTFEQSLLAWVANDTRLDKEDVTALRLRSQIGRAPEINHTRAVRLLDRWDIHTIPRKDRCALYRYWCELARDEAMRRHEDALDRLAKLQAEHKRLQREQDLAVVHRADILALTTTGASKHSHLLEATQPTIVLCEEAAEVLEPHIIASLTASCQHLVLIGDHQQLRPTANHYPMEKRNYNISLFERMVNNQIPSQQLSVQHRMHPKIAAVLVPHIYKKLQHHESVNSYEEVRGMAQRVHYVQHSHQEHAVSEKTSRCNEQEANYLVHLAHYLLLQDYSPSDITILATYRGQMRLIRDTIQTFCHAVPEPRYSVNKRMVLLDQEFRMLKELEQSSIERLVGRREEIDAADVRNMKEEYRRRSAEIQDMKDKSKLLDVRVSTVDNFQGEENKIILLSFVRSNTEGRIGFLKWANRICVALSRAKQGFYATGNFKLFARESDVWKKICEQLLLARTLSDGLNLKCPHGTIQTVKQPNDFRLLAPDGGCGEVCLYRLDCGHVCSRFCHGGDTEHKQNICKKWCEGTLDCEHTCGRICTKPQDPEATRKCSICKKTIDCPVMIDITPPCGHRGKTRCAKESVYMCQIPVNFYLPCGHSQTQPCCSDRSQLVCIETVTEKLEACGHEIHRRCPNPVPLCTTTITLTLECRHDLITECWRRKQKQFCMERITLKLECGHEFHTACSRKNESKLCMEEVRQELKCSHIRLTKCHKSQEDVDCEVPVPLTLTCGHEKMVPCTASQRPLVADQECNELVTVTPPCKHEYMVPCSQKDEEPGPCSRRVKKIWARCRHVVKVLCHDVDELMRSGCRAKEKRRLECGHEVSVLCGSSDLPECRKPCMWSCPHGSCLRNCGEPCSRCTRPCRNSCRHSSCTRPCWELCDRDPCNERCDVRLRCGHRCWGLCGEPCPRVCPNCRNRRPEITVRLSPCGHELPLTVMDRHMRLQNGPAGQRYCPLRNCGDVITHCPRYQSELKMARASTYDRIGRAEHGLNPEPSPEEDQWPNEHAADHNKNQSQPGPSNSSHETGENDDLPNEKLLPDTRTKSPDYVIISDTDSDSPENSSKFPERRRVRKSLKHYAKSSERPRERYRESIERYRESSKDSWSSSERYTESPKRSDESCERYTESRERSIESPEWNRESSERYRSRESMERYTESPERYRESLERYTESPERYRELVERYTESPERYRESVERYTESPERYRESPERYTESPERHRESLERDTESPERYRESVERFTESSEGHRESLERYTGSPEQYSEDSEGYRYSPQRYRQSPDGYTECQERGRYGGSPNRYRVSAGRYTESPERYRKSPERYSETLKRYRDSPELGAQSPKRFRESTERYEQSPEHFHLPESRKLERYEASPVRYGRSISDTDTDYDPKQDNNSETSDEEDAGDSIYELKHSNDFPF